MKKMYSDFKNNGNFKELQENNISFTQSINVDINCSLTECNEWKYKCITSELTLYFLIENKKDNIFPDWECW